MLTTPVVASCRSTRVLPHLGIEGEEYFAKRDAEARKKTVVAG